LTSSTSAKVGVSTPRRLFTFGAWNGSYCAPAYFFSPSSMFFLSWLMSTSADSAASLSCCSVMCFGLPWLASGSSQPHVMHISDLLLNQLLALIFRACESIANKQVVVRPLDRKQLAPDRHIRRELPAGHNSWPLVAIAPPNKR